MKTLANGSPCGNAAADLDRDRRGKARPIRRPHWHPVIELLEERCMLDCTGTALTERTYDGTCNNLVNETWGSTDVALLRMAPAEYDDGINTPVVGSPPRPSARVISNILSSQTADLFDSRFLSAMMYAFGQFVDHDLDLTKPENNPPVPFNIPVPACDPFFDPLCTGTQIIALNRSKVVPGTGTDVNNPRQQPNLITAYLDGSAVYGSDPSIADQLRTHVDGKMKVSGGNMLPFNNSNYFANCPPLTPCIPMDNPAQNVENYELFAAGDSRANENVELLSLHTLFVREHNYWAQRIKNENPTFTDEQIYQLARHIVGAELQAITYNDWIPAVLGENALPAYQGYDDTVNAGIANEFSTASFRLGHSMVDQDVKFLDNNGNEVSPPIPINESFFNPPIVSEIGIGPILKYLASDSSQRADRMIVDAMRNFLFGPPGSGD